MDTKATVYEQDLWGYKRLEVQNLKWTTVPHAQYANAIRIEYTVRGKRKPTVLVVTGRPGLVALDGWDHPEPPATLAPKDEEQAAAGIKETRRASCDPEWDAEFKAFLDGYIAGAKPTVSLDTRNHQIKLK
jgi:hypothetical protein